MNRLTLRRAASIFTVVLFLATFIVVNSLWFYIVLAAAILLETWVQRSTEIGWRIFRGNLDERQVALRARILDLSYRSIAILAVVALFVLAVFLPRGPAGRAAWFFAAPDDPYSFVLKVIALIIFAIWLLPGLIAAWIEPVAEEEPESATQTTG